MGDRGKRGGRRGVGRAFVLVAMVLVGWEAALGQLQAIKLQSSDQVDGVAIVLTRMGPYPNSFTHAATPFLLSIVNRSGTLEDTFSLISNVSRAATPPAAGVAIQSLLDLHSTSARQRDHQIIKPLPGNYQLVFKAHPDWVVNITITAN